RQAYREYLMHGQQPVHFLLLALPPDAVDVNVHPQKAEVRFLDGRRVCGVLHEAVREALRGRSGAEARGALSVGRGKPRAVAGFPDLTARLFDPPEGVAERPTPTFRAAAEAVREATAAPQPAPAAPQTAEFRDRPAFDRPAFDRLKDRRFLQVLD